MIHHLIWLILHVGFYYLIPDYGASISLLLYLIYELVKNYTAKRKFQYIHLYFLGLVITVIANITIITGFKSAQGYESYIYAIPDLFPLSALIFAIGNQFLAIGYYWKTNFRLPNIFLKTLLSVGVLNTIFWIGLFFSFNKFWLFFSLPGSFQTIIELFPIVGIFVLGRYAGKFQKKSLYTKSLVLTIATAFNALLFSYLRLEILLPILVFILSYFLGAGSLKSLFTVKFIPVILLILIFYSFFGMFGAKRSNISTGLDRLAQLDFTVIEDQNYSFKEEETLSAFERSSNIAQISAVCGLVEKNGHYNGLASSPLVLALVPRVFWPEKPVIALGVWYAVEIGAAVEVDGWYNNSINMTIPGQLFLDFGWIGLIIGSFLVGMFLKLLWDSVNFYKSQFNLLGTFFAVYLLYTAFLGIGADLQILITYLAIYLTMLILSKIFKTKHENSVRRPSLARK